MSDLTGLRLIETATHCRRGDDKRPALVGLPIFTTTQVCPDELNSDADEAGVAEGAPPLWFVRVVFDELLDPTVEDLIPQNPANPAGPQIGTLRNTQPVTLRCQNLAGAMVDVPYDGYYAPNGNRVSWPLGPSLFIQPAAATSVPTGASCNVALKAMIHDKTGVEVPMEERSFNFKIAPHFLRFTDPDPEEPGIGLDDGTFELSPEAVITFFWSAPLVSPINTTDFLIFEGPNVGGGPNPGVCDGGGTAVPGTEINAATVMGNALLMELFVTDPANVNNTWKPSTTYRIEFGPAAKVPTTQGSIPGTPDGTFPEGLTFCFHTSAPA